MTTQNELRDRVAELAEELEVPGVAVGVVIGDEDHAAFHGVTSIEDPLEVDAGTLFQIGSTGKTYTSTAIMRMVEDGRIDLDAPVRTYVPELKLKDDSVARDVTVLHLLNHSAGWDGDLFKETGEGDDALERYVALMADIEQVTPLGAGVSYNNASLGLAGLVLQRVAGSTYEQAVRDLVLDPLGMRHSLFDSKQIMTRRFSNGHRRSQDGTTEVVRPWDQGRYAAPMGGLASNVGDQLAWARFHMGDGTAPDGTRVLAAETLERMQRPTIECPGNALGDAVGISWLLRDVEGLAVVAHGGDTTGQHSIFEMVPERGFALDEPHELRTQRRRVQRGDLSVGDEGVPGHRDHRSRADASGRRGVSGVRGPVRDHRHHHRPEARRRRADRRGGGAARGARRAR